MSLKTCWTWFQKSLSSLILTPKHKFENSSTNQALWVVVQGYKILDAPETKNRHLIFSMSPRNIDQVQSETLRAEGSKPCDLVNQNVDSMIIFIFFLKAVRNTWSPHPNRILQGHTCHHSKHEGCAVHLPCMVDHCPLDGNLMKQRISIERFV